MLPTPGTVRPFDLPIAVHGSLMGRSVQGRFGPIIFSSGAVFTLNDFAGGREHRFRSRASLDCW